MNLRTLVLAGVLAAFPAVSTAKTSPTEIGARIDRSGAAATVSELAAKHKWHRVLAHIGTGKPEWLALAPRLAPGTEASQSLALTIALADALPRRAAGVLAVAAIAKGPLAIDRVCAAPYIEPKATDLAYYRTRARRAVEGVTAPPLQAAKRACLAALHPRAGSKPAHASRGIGQD